MQVTVIGAGNVGRVTGERFMAGDHELSIVDPDVEKAQLAVELGERAIAAYRRRPAASRHKPAAPRPPAGAAGPLAHRCPDSARRLLRQRGEENLVAAHGPRRTLLPGS